MTKKEKDIFLLEQSIRFWRIKAQIPDIVQQAHDNYLKGWFIDRFLPCPLCKEYDKTVYYVENYNEFTTNACFNKNFFRCPIHEETNEAGCYGTSFYSSRTSQKSRNHMLLWLIKLTNKLKGETTNETNT